MPTITSLGVGSGLQLNQLLDGLVNAERAPTEARLNQKEQEINVKLSAYSGIKSKLSELQSSIAVLSDIDTFEKARTIAIGDSDKLSAEIDGDAAEGSYQIEVQTLARAHVLHTAQDYATTNTVVGEGTLTFRFGTTNYTEGTDTYTSFTANASSATYSVTIDSSNSTLTGIRDAINNADIGVTASIINDGDGYELVLRSQESGEDYSMEVSVTQTSGNLNALRFNSTSTDLEQSVAGTDAAIEIDGIAVTSSTNTFDSVIDGISFTALDTMSTGITTSLTISNDVDSVREKIDTFITAYNDMVTTLNGYTTYNEATEIAEPLAGDSTVRSILSQVRNSLTQEMAELGDAYSFMFNIGIKTTSTGTLQVDTDPEDGDLLDKALADDLTAVGRFFAIEGVTTDSQVSYSNYDDEDTQTGTYAVNITQLATQGTYTAANYSVPALTIDANNDTFELKVDGVQTGTITLTQGVYADYDALALEIQSRINADSALQNVGTSVSVANDGSKFTITSARYGSASNIEFTAVDTDTAAELGFSVSSGTAGLDVAGTINGVAASGAGQTLISDSGNSKGLQLLISGGSTGARGSVSFSRGLADGASQTIEDLLDTDNVIEARITGLNSRLELIEEEREELEQRIENLESRLRSQFTSLDILVSQFNATGTFLSQQLSAGNNNSK